MGYEMYRQLASKKGSAATAAKKRKPPQQRRMSGKKSQAAGPECVDLEEEDRHLNMLDGKKGLFLPGLNLTSGHSFPVL